MKQIGRVHLLEEYDLAEDILKQVNAHLMRKGLLVDLHRNLTHFTGWGVRTKSWTT
jgi:hypothetical protein